MFRKDRRHIRLSAESGNSLGCTLRLCRGRFVQAAFVLLAFFLLPQLSGCGDDNGGSLGGSLGDIYDISFETVRARLYPSELAIEYVNAAGEVPVRITVRLVQVDVVGPATVDLASKGDITGSAAGIQMPRLKTGTLELKTYKPADSADVKGDFTANLGVGDSKYSLHGDFNTTLEVVETQDVSAQ